jgi:hypothetical protein
VLQAGADTLQQGPTADAEDVDTANEKIAKAGPRTRV